MAGSKSPVKRTPTKKKTIKKSSSVKPKKKTATEMINEAKKSNRKYEIGAGLIALGVGAHLAHKKYKDYKNLDVAEASHHKGISDYYLYQRLLS